MVNREYTVSYCGKFPVSIFTKSLDTSLLARMLCYVNDAYRLLCEVDRVLIDNSWLVIRDFKPPSL